MICMFCIMYIHTEKKSSAFDNAEEEAIALAARFASIESSEPSYDPLGNTFNTIVIMYIVQYSSSSTSTSSITLKLFPYIHIILISNNNHSTNVFMYCSGS